MKGFLKSPTQVKQNAFLPGRMRSYGTVRNPRVPRTRQIVGRKGRKVF
jgi:hypothetical protein